MVSGARLGHVPDPACSAPLGALSARSRPAASGSGPQSPNRTGGSSTGRHGATEYRVYHGGMAPDTSTLPRPPTPAARPEPAATGPAATATATAATTAARAPGASETATLAVADSAAPPAPEAPPDLDQLGNRIAELSARIQAATYELLCDVREFDRHHGWEGFRSCAHWLNWRTGLDLGAAREKLRVAAALADLNHLSAAMACGRLSYSIVRALTRVATADNEARLIAVACCATAAQVERLVRGWRQADREAQPDAEQVRLERRALSTRVDEDGMVVLRARLTPEVGAVVLRALEAALEQVPAVAEDAAGGDEASIAQRRADALGLVAESALAGGLDPGSSGDRFQVTVHVEADGLCGRGRHGRAARFRPHQHGIALLRVQGQLDGSFGVCNHMRPTEKDKCGPRAIRCCRRLTASGVPPWNRLRRPRRTRRRPIAIPRLRQAPCTCRFDADTDARAGRPALACGQGGADVAQHRVPSRSTGNRP